MCCTLYAVQRWGLKWVRSNQQSDEIVHFTKYWQANTAITCGHHGAVVLMVMAYEWQPL